MFIDKNNIRFYLEKRINHFNHFDLKNITILEKDFENIKIELPDKRDLGFDSNEDVVIYVTCGVDEETIKGGYELIFPNIDDTKYTLMSCPLIKNIKGELRLGTGNNFIYLCSFCLAKLLNSESVVIGKNCTFTVNSTFVFLDNFKLKTVDFENCNTDFIPPRMFDRCKNLEKIILPSNLKKIQKDSFSCCSKLKSITFPETVKYLGEAILYNTKELKEIIFTGKLPTIRYDTFYGVQRLKVKIYVPDEYIKSYKKHKELKYFNILPLSSHISSFGVKLIGKTGIGIVQKLNNTGDENLYTGIVKIPKYLYDYNRKKRLVKNIDPFAFFGCENLKEIIMPKSLKRKDIIVDKEVKIKYHDED